MRKIYLHKRFDSFEFPGSKLYYLSLKCIKKYNVSMKNDGFKTWVKVWIVKFNPKVWLFIKN